MGMRSLSEQQYKLYNKGDCENKKWTLWKWCIFLKNEKKGKKERGFSLSFEPLLQISWGKVQKAQNIKTSYMQPKGIGYCKS